MSAPYQDFDEEMIREFGDEFTDACELIEQTLDQLASTPEDMDLVNALFRHVHTVKGNLRMVEFNDIALFVHAIEDIIDAIRHEQLHYDHLLKDVTLLAMEKVQDMFNAAFAGQSLDDFDHLPVQAILEKIPARKDNYQQLVIETCQLLDPGYEPPPGNITETTYPHQETASPNPGKDLVAFHQMAIRFENRLPGWDMRTEHLLEICEEMNNAAGKPIDSSQLAAAVCLHDIAMDTESAPVTAADWQAVDNPGKHIALAVRLANTFSGWEEAVAMIRQHHECIDGSGFPSGLAGSNICEGARLLAVAERFTDLVMDAVHPSKAAIMDTLKQINTEFDTRLDRQWLEPLIQVIRQRYL
jgi:chemotaxis protein histidine kinase CheA